MLLLASTTSWVMFGVGVTLMIAILLRRSWRYQHRQRQTPRSRPKGPAGSGPSVRHPHPAEPPVEAGRWQVEMYDFARDVKAELDSKMGALQALVRVAREESLRLEEAIRRAQTLGLAASRDSLEAIQQLAESSTPAENAELPALAENRVLDLIQPSEQRARVYALSDAGQSPQAIADRMQVTVGEVELMLSVRPRAKGHKPDD